MLIKPTKIIGYEVKKIINAKIIEKRLEEIFNE